MKEVFSWVDNQMKRVALLSGEEQNLSVWYYLSQLQPLAKERKNIFDSNKEIEDNPNPKKSIAEETALGNEEEDFSLNLDDYIEDEEDFGLKVEDYLDEDEDAYHLNKTEFLDMEENHIDINGATQSIPNKSNDLFGMDFAQLKVDELGHDQKEETKKLLSVKKYVAAAVETDDPEVEIKHNRKHYQELNLTIRPLIDFFGNRKLLEYFLSILLASYWENTFPPYFSINKWLNEFEGEIYLAYHPEFVIQIGFIPLTLEDFSKFTNQKYGMVQIGIPWSPIFYYTWKFSFSRNNTEAPSQRHSVFLAGERLERHEFYQLNRPEKKQVIIIDSENPSSILNSQMERISKLNSVTKVHRLSAISFYDMYSNWNIKNSTLPPKLGLSTTKRVIDIPVYLRMQVNNWAEKKESLDKLIGLLSTAVGEMCNEWWLEYSPEDVIVIKKILEVGRCFQTNVITHVKEILKRNKQILVDFKSESFDRKQDFFMKIEQSLIPVYDVLNADTKVGYNGK